jgi:hypothetical protein
MNKMTVTSAQYTQGHNNTNNGVKATIDGVSYIVPLDTANRHYQAILDWVADGNTIQDAS